MEQKTRPQLFLEVSALLTGFSETELKSTGMLDVYYNTILQNTVTEATEYFFRDLNTLLTDPKRTDKSVNATLAAEFMPSSSYSGLAQNTIMLWYTGNWGQNVVSAESYIQGLMWDAGHSHPPGAKQPGYGSWANLPLDVQQSTQKSKPNEKK